MTGPEANVEVQYADHAHQSHASRLGMWVFIGSEVLFFTVLFTIFAWFRTRYTADFSEAARHAKVVIGSANTFVLLTSSFSMATAVDAVRRGRRSLLLVTLGVTLLLGLAFLGLKLYEYSLHIDEGALPGATYRFAEAPTRGGLLFFTLYWVATGFHALHMVIGVGLVAWLIVRAARGAYSPESHATIENVGIYWHFVDLVWIFLWPLFYLAH